MVKRQQGWRWSLLVALALGCGPAPAGDFDEDGVRVTHLGLPEANVTLVEKGMHHVLVDSGPVESLGTIEQLLKARGLTLDDLEAVVLTHGHSDHAGNARAMQLRGVPIFAGQDDLDMLKAGKNRDFTPTGPDAVLLGGVLSHTFTPVTPDSLFKEDTSMANLGIPMEVRMTPGHTAGSVSVVVAGKVAVVGDMVRSGDLGATVNTGQPRTHYFHEDMAKDNEALDGLLKDERITTYFVGHGSPVTRDALLEWQKTR